MDTTEPKTIYTALELSALSGLSKPLILTRIKKGTIKARKMMNYLYVIDQEEVERMREAGEFRRMDGKRHDLTHAKSNPV
jgi:hypothetical protein